ncbi:MAG: hypothetical protein ABUS47_16305 [Steroidobacter sp.]
MKLSKIITLILLLAISNVALATATNTPAAVPANLHVYDSAGNSYVDLVASGCSGARYYIDPNFAAYKTIMSILLTAEVTQRQVVIRFDGCNSNNQGFVVGVYLP